MAKENQVAGRIKVLICSPCFREIIPGFPGECNVIIGVRERGRGHWRRVIVRGKWEIWKDSRERCNVLVLTMEEGATSQGMGLASGSRKRPGNGLSPGAARKEHGPTNTVSPAQRDLGQTSGPQDCEITNSC